jgi:NAD(P)-dependent dehydrogenase (short-subunit alcohol dehydrogenase family)
MGRPTVIVTGASSGIGRAAAFALARHGAQLLLIGRDADRLEQTRSLAGHAVALAVDLEAPDAVERVLDEARRLGHVEALVNAAGLAELRPFEATDRALLRRMMAVNFEAPALLIAGLWPMWVHQKQGVVVNVSSLAAHDPFPGFCAYAASKAALESLGRSIACEAGPIEAYSLAIGAVETPMLRSMFTTQQLPERHVLAPEVIADVIVECVLGRRRADAGKTLFVHSPSPDQPGHDQ